jgi:hypothetical protein
MLVPAGQTLVLHYFFDEFSFMIIIFGRYILTNSDIILIFANLCIIETNHKATAAMRNWLHPPVCMEIGSSSTMGHG